MTTPDPSDEGHIADTGTFQRFVEHEQAMDRREGARSGKSSVWLVLVAIIAILVVAGVIWALAR